MRKGRTGWLWQSGDQVFVHKNDLPEPHRSNRRLLTSGLGYRSGEVVLIDDQKRKVQVALRIRGRSFVIGVGEIVPMVLLDPQVIDDQVDETPGAEPVEQFSLDPWVTPELNLRVRINTDIRVSHGMLLFAAGEVVPAKRADEPSWDVYGFDALCPRTRKTFFVDRSLASVVE